MNSAVGPVDGGRCYHGDVSLELDPDPAYLATCSEPSVFAVPSPEGTRATGPLRFCEYHLARYLEAVRDDVEAELVARGARHYAADPVFVRLDDAPDEIHEDNRGWFRYALDQRGRVHYVDRARRDVLVLAPSFAFAIKRLGGDYSTHFEAVRARVGLAALDDRADHPLADDDRELVADGGLEVRWVDLSAARRDVLVAIESAPGEWPTGPEVRAILEEWKGEAPNPGPFSVQTRDLEADGLLKSDRDGNAKAYRLTRTGRDLLVDRLEVLTELLGDRLESWTTVVEREARNPDRVVDDAFCSRCGSVWAGDGVCPECEDRVEEELVADGGHRLPDLELPGFGDDQELAPDGGQPVAPDPPRPVVFRCFACEALDRGIPWAVGGGTSAGELLGLDPVQLVDVCDGCMAEIADELETTEERAIADGGLDLDDPVLVEREVLRELVDVAKGKLEGDTAHGSPGYDVDAFAKTIAHGERALRGGGST